MQDLIQKLLASSGWRHDQSIVRIIPVKHPDYLDIPPNLTVLTRQFLDSQGISKMFSHQAQALDCLATGANVLLATPTASGKSLVFQIPVLEKIQADSSSNALMLFPFKALARDQLRHFVNDSNALQPVTTSRPLAAVYDGDTGQPERKRIQRQPPHILITNPDMLHYSFLPYHTRWRSFLESVKYIVADEIHTYRGVFGSHVLQTFRRLMRVLRHYGSAPQIIACSATIGNPELHIQNLFETDFSIIKESGAPTESKAFISHFPDDSASTAAVRMLRACINNNLKTIVFTKSRRQTELIYRYITRNNPELLLKLAVYRAGFMPEHRREIEQKLFNNKLVGVISTSALELGIDIGGLDCCILVGFPGSISSLMQRAGRVGRKHQPSIVMYIAGEDALDRYWYEHEALLHTSPIERAVVYSDNDNITDMHLKCAADELMLTPGHNYPDTPHIQDRISHLTETHRLLESAEGGSYVCRESHPQRRISFRSIGESWQIKHPERGVIGHVDGIRVYKECHPGAIYLHSGEVFQVEHMDCDNYIVRIVKGPDDIYTQAYSTKETDILEITGERTIHSLTVFNGRLRVRERVTGYAVKRIYTGEVVTRHDLEMPETVFETRGLWMAFADYIIELCKQRGLHPMGGLHALEHALIGLYPLFSICDRYDLAGISTPAHYQTNGPAVFVYDAFPGGLGLAESALDDFEKLLTNTLKHIASCSCHLGCPYCIHSPKCGSGNVPLDKQSTICILEYSLGKETMSVPKKNQTVSASKSTEQGHLFSGPKPLQSISEPIDTLQFVIPELPDPTDCLSGTELVFDIETQLSADEVGGWHNTHKMRIAICVVYDIEADRYEFYHENHAGRLIDRLKNAAHVIGYNSELFDFSVLKRYTSASVISQFTSLDLITGVTRGLGHRTGLDRVAAATLGAGKTADGLQSLQWWREGRLDKIAEYCKMDVELTKDIYLFGKQHGYVMHAHRSGQMIRVPVSW
jgi:DEAD/DEAH box helicase domain-containing protein